MLTRVNLRLVMKCTAKIIPSTDCTINIREKSVHQLYAVAVVTITQQILAMLALILAEEIFVILAIVVEVPHTGLRSVTLSAMFMETNFIKEATTMMIHAFTVVNLVTGQANATAIVPMIIINPW